MNNPNESASKPQRWALFCSSGMDFRTVELTREVASTLLGNVQHLRGNKIAAREVIENLLAGKVTSLSVPAISAAPVKSRDDAFKELYNRAYEAGKAAANATKPVPMIVGHSATVFGNDIDPNQPIYHVSDGCCGFAWVSVRPGNSAFANWLKKNNLARADSYAGGVSIWIHEYRQSLQLKETHASAMAQVFSEAGLRAYSNSRMD